MRGQWMWIFYPMGIYHRMLSVEKLLDVLRMREFQCPTEVAKTYRPLRCWICQGIRANMYGVIVTVFIVCSFFSTSCKSCGLLSLKMPCQ